MQRLFMLALFVLHLSLCSSQAIHENYTSPLLRTEKKSTFFLSLEHTQFFKNNEYFNKLYKGYTLPGYHLTPLATYLIDNETYVQGGFFTTQFYGQSGFYLLQPIFRIHHQFTKKFTTTLGYLDGNLRHQMPDPVYHFDNYFFNPVETGIQLQYTGNIFSSDTWIDWKEFILWGDEKQEVFTAGSRNEFILFSTDQGFSASIPLSAMICHRGGQIQNIDTPMVNISNFHSGLQSTFSTGSEWVKNIAVGALLFYYHDMSHTLLQKYNTGHAYMPYISLKNQMAELTVSYWEANRFIAPRGNPVYHSYNSFGSQTFTNRQLLNCRLNLFRHYNSGFTAGGQIEVFYDLKNNIADYHLGIFFAFHRDFFKQKI